MTITLDQIKELRSRTGAGVLDAKNALNESDGDLDKAMNWLREKGKASAAKKSARETKEGVVASYVHGNNKVAVLVAVTCETDFVARNEKFQELAKNIALHIVASDPLVVSPDDLSETELGDEIAFIDKQLAEDKKPEDIKAKIKEGKVKKFKEGRALLTQPFVKDPSKTIEDLLKEAISELGENITVAEFKRISI